jgi:hypothetical protein
MAHAFKGKSGAYRIAILQVRFAPVPLYGLPGIAQAFFIGIAVLRHDGGHPVGSRQSQPEARWGTVVKHVKGVTREIEDLGKGKWRPGQGITSNMKSRLKKSAPRFSAANCSRRGGWLR